MTGTGAGACAGGESLAGDLRYLYTPELQGKEGGSDPPPPRQRLPGPHPHPRVSASQPPALRAGRCGGGSRLRGSSLAKGPAADVGAPAPVHERQRQPGDGLATRLQTSSPPVGRGGCPGGSAGLKENSPSSRQPGRVFPKSTRTPPPGARGHTAWHTRAHTRTRAHTLARPFPSCPGPKLRSQGAETDRSSRALSSRPPDGEQGGGGKGSPPPRSRSARKPGRPQPSGCAC